MEKDELRELIREVIKEFFIINENADRHPIPRYRVTYYPELIKTTERLSVLADRYDKTLSLLESWSSECSEKEKIKEIKEDVENIKNSIEEIKDTVNEIKNLVKPS